MTWLRFGRGLRSRAAVQKTPGGRCRKAGAGL